MSKAPRLVPVHRIALGKSPLRRRHVVLAGVAGACAAASGLAWGQGSAAATQASAADVPIGGLPAKPVRILVGFAAGGALDITARTIAPRLAEVLGQPVVVENKPGASSNLASAEVARAAPDGLTLLMGSYVNAVLPSVLRTLGYDPIKDLKPIGRVVTTASVLIVATASPVRSIDELVAQVRSKPGEVSYSSAGNGSASHLAGSLFANRLGVQMVHVPYKGSPQAISDVISGQVNTTFAVMSGALAQINGGRARPLAVTSLGRSRYLPDVPSVAESGFPGYEQLQWYAFFGPGGLSSALTERLNREIMRIMQLPEVTRQLAQQGLDVAPSTPAELQTLMRAEIASYQKIVHDAGITPS